jgi:3-dehydroquinate synthase
VLCVDGGISYEQRKNLQTAFQVLSPYVYEVSGGELVKTRGEKEALEDWFLSMHLGADTTVVGVGGGATLDLVAFFAATYGRGVPLLLIPSTTLAMADASFGGKCGVNVNGVKNIVGTIYHPTSILVNVELLLSLPRHRMASGLVEVAKHALLDSLAFVHDLLSSWEDCCNGNLECLEWLISKSICVKAKFCTQLKEDRHFLNLGHTVGHALEKLEGPTLAHGTAVAIGLLVEGIVGQRRGIVSQEVVDIITEVVKLVVPNPPLTRIWGLEAWKSALQHDKKKESGKPHVVWLHAIGDPHTVNGIGRIPLDESEVEYAYDLLKSFAVC